MNEEKLYIISLIKENDKLKEEIKKLKDDIERIDNLRATYQIWNGDKGERIKEAIEYIENPRHEMSVKSYQELLEILKGTDKE